MPLQRRGLLNHRLCRSFFCIWRYRFFGDRRSCCCLRWGCRYRWLRGGAAGTSVEKIKNLIFDLLTSDFRLNTFVRELNNYLLRGDGAGLDTYPADDPFGDLWIVAGLGIAPAVEEGLPCLFGINAIGFNACGGQTTAANNEFEARCGADDEIAIVVHYPRFLSGTAQDFGIAGAPIIATNTQVITGEGFRVGALTAVPPPVRYQSWRFGFRAASAREFRGGERRR